MSIFGFFKRGRALLRPIEALILDALAEQLDIRGREILASQIGLLDRVHRFKPDEREVLLWMPKRLANDVSTMFPNRTLEAKLARVRLVDGAGKGIANADVVLVTGHVFTLLFSHSPKQFPAMANVRVRDVKLLIDPMLPVETVMPSHTSSMSASHLKGWLAEWPLRNRVSDITVPRSERDRENHLRQLDSAIPQDYREMMAVSDGFVIDSCAVLSISEVYMVSLSQGDYSVLATTPDGILALRKGDKTATVWFVGHDGDAPLPLGDSIRTAIERTIVSAV